MGWTSAQMKTYMERDPGTFEEFLLDCMAKWYSKQPVRRQRTHHSSNIRGCHRADYYAMGKGLVPVEFTRGFDFIPIWTGERGKAFHEFTSEFFKAADALAMVFDWETDDNGELVNPGKLVQASEVVLNQANVPTELWSMMQEYNISGIIDDIPIIDGVPVLLEKKTKDSKVFDAPGMFQYFEEDRLKWYDQVQMYMHLLRLPDGTQLKKAIIWTIDSGDYKRHPTEEVIYDPAHIELILMELDRSHQEALAAPDGLPHRQTGKDFKNCHYCVFRKTICHPDLFIEW